MRCVEVIEYMQRNLDGDLSPQEYALMDEHLHACNECREWNEKLTRLSFELESLPDIEPPFSLVDSILPQFTGSSVLLTQRPGKIDFSRRNWNKYWTIAGGAAAVLVVALLWGNNSGRPDVKSDLKMETASAPSITNPTISSVDNKQAAKQEVANKPSNSGAEPKSENATLTKKSQYPSSVAMAPQAPQTLRADQSGGNKVTDIQKETSKVVVVEKPNKALTTAEPSDQSLHSASSDQAAPQPENPEQTLMEKSAQQIPSKPHAFQPENAPMALAPQSSTRTAPKTLTSTDDKQLSTGVGQSFPSPSGEWLATLEGHSLAVHHQMGAEVYHSHQWGDVDHVNVYWGSDSQLFYEIFTTNGMERWVLNVQTGQEQKQ